MREHGFKTESEVSEELGVKIWRIRYLRENGTVPFQKIGREIVYTDVEVKLLRLLLAEKQGV